MLAGGASCIGEAHKRAGIPLQDSFNVYTHPSGKYTIAIVSDGAGSAKHAEIGSSRVVSEFIAEIKRLCDQSSTFSFDAFKEAVPMAIQSTRAALVNDGYTLRDCHATVVAAVTFPDRCLLVHLGDGLAMAFIEEPSGAIAVCTSEPENGDASNETFFYTESNWKDHLRITEIPRAVLGCMLMSDGMEDFAWNPESGIKTGFTKPIIERAKAANNSQSLLDKVLYDVVSDERTNQFTSDDKTLCLVISEDGYSKLSANEVIFNQYVIRNGSPVPLNSPTSTLQNGSIAEQGTSQQKAEKPKTSAPQLDRRSTELPPSKQSQVAEKYKNNSLLKVFIFFFSYLAVFLIGFLVGTNFKGPFFQLSDPLIPKTAPKPPDVEPVSTQSGQPQTVEQKASSGAEASTPRAPQVSETPKSATTKDKPKPSNPEAKKAPALVTDSEPKEGQKPLEPSRTQMK